MEDIKKAAIAYYKRADENTQQIAKQFFNSVDKDGNNEISHSEFIEALKQRGFKESEENELANLFEKLDTNRDKHLDFNEAVVFYYVIQHKTTLFCCGCGAWLGGIYFSCFECHQKEGNTYDLCIDCYRKGKSVDHMHKTLYDNHYLLQLYRNLEGCTDETNEAKDNISPTSGRKRAALARISAKLVPSILKSAADPEPTSSGKTGTVSSGSNLLPDAAGGIGNVGGGIASGVSHVSETLMDTCCVM